MQVRSSVRACIARPLCALLLLAACTGDPSASRAPGPLAAPRFDLLLNGDWQRAGGDAAAPPVEGWEVVRVPEFHVSATRGSAWFRLDLVLPAELGEGDRRIWLRIGRARHHARVHVNGTAVGEHYGSRAAFELDVTEAIEPGRRNRIEIFVEACFGDAVRPSGAVADDETAKRFCPRYAQRDRATVDGDVWIVARPRLTLASVAITTSVQLERIDVETVVENATGRERELRLEQEVWSGSDRLLSLPGQVLRIAPHARLTVVSGAEWRDPRLWDLPPHGEPALHQLVSRLVDADGSLVDRLPTRFGFREIWSEGDRLLLNGRDLRILAYWLAEADGRTLATGRLAAVQLVGANAIHNHTQQADPAFYDVADELGLLVWDSNYCGGPAGASEHVDGDRPFPEVVEALEQPYRAWARSVRNHPSVALIQAACLLNGDSASQLARVYREEDPTRPIHGSAQPVSRVEPSLWYPIPVAASFVDVTAEDPARDLRHVVAMLGRIHRLPAPLILREVYQRGAFEPGITLADVALATARALDFLAGTDVRAVALTGSLQFLSAAETPDPQWPSRSGEGVHAFGRQTPGGLHEFVNLAHPDVPAVTVLPEAEIQREAAGRFLGYEVAVARLRRPEALITLVDPGGPVADAFVYGEAVGAPHATVVGIRTDVDGRAWFALREPGSYRFSSIGDGEWREGRLEAPLQPLDLSRGGIPAPLPLELRLRRPHRPSP
jgi:hypothetical protein